MQKHQVPSFFLNRQHWGGKGTITRHNKAQQSVSRSHPSAKESIYRVWNSQVQYWATRVYGDLVTSMVGMFEDLERHPHIDGARIVLLKVAVALNLLEQLPG
jgi:hypothetical protein